MLRHTIKRVFSTIVRAPEFKGWPQLTEYNAFDFNFKLGKYVSKRDRIFTAELLGSIVPILSEHQGFVIHDYMFPRLCKEILVGEPLFTLSDNPFTEEDNIDLVYKSYLNKLQNNELLNSDELYIFRYIADQMNDNDVTWNCGIAFYRSNKFPEADKIFMKMDRNYPRLTFLKGLIKFELGDYHSAMNFFDQSNDDDGQYGKTLMYTKLGINKGLVRHILENIGDIEEFEIKN